MTEPPTNQTAPRTRASGGAALFVGREHHLGILDDALAAASQGGRAVTVFVHGPPGMGRSALLRRFFEGAIEGGALVLEGRCVEGAIAPFAALAGVARALAEHVAALPAREARELLPRDLRDLARAFPELARGAAAAISETRSPATPIEPPDPAELRRRAAAALCELLAAIGARQPLVVAIDELQWGDEDSARMLLDVLRGDGEPAMVLVAGYRSGDVERVTLARALRRQMARGEATGDVREVMVGPLEPSEARALARALLGRDDAVIEEGEARGEGEERADPAAIARTSGGSPRLLVELARRALGVEETDAEGARVAAAIDREDAAIAADRADRALAFHRAAMLHGRAIEAGGRDPAALGELAVKRALALSRAGSNAEAARALLDASAAAAAGDALALRCRAAGELLRAGSSSEGLALAAGVLDAAGLALPGTPRRALASLFYQRVRLSLRGEGAREAGDDPAALARVDAATSIAGALAAVDPIRAAPLQARGLRMALDTGNPGRIAIAAARAAIAAALEGGPDGGARAAALTARSIAAAEQAGDPRALAWSAAARASIAFHAARFGEAATLSRAAIDRFREGSDDACSAAGEVVASSLLPSILRLGRLDELAARARFDRDEAARAGDQVVACAIGARVLPHVWLAEGSPIEARRDAFEATRAGGSSLDRLGELHASALALLYEGDGAGAHRHVGLAWPHIEASRLLRFELPRVEATHLRAACALAAAAASRGADAERLLSAAARDARALEREESAYAAALAAGVRAGIATARGDLSPAAALFGEAAGAFEALEMGLHVAAMRRRQGELALGDEGRSLVDAADRWMMGRGVRDPERMAAIVAPRAG